MVCKYYIDLKPTKQWDFVKNKLVVSLTIAFSLFFLVFVVRITDDLSKANSNILKSQNVIDVTNLISTRLLIAEKILEVDDRWVKEKFDDSEWGSIRIPKFQIVKMQNFKEGNHAYYRIKVPKSAFTKINHLKSETFLFLQSIYFNRFDIIINGKFYRTYNPRKPGENRVVIPVDEGIDNIVGIRGHIKTGDTGIDSRNKIMLGKGLEFNEVHSANYKGQTVFQLVFILCKGSILFVFALIYLLLKVDRSFEKFFIFGICAVIEELVAGDYFHGLLNFNQMVYLYNFANVGASVSVFLFFADLVSYKIRGRLVLVFALILIFISSFLAFDSLYWNYIVDLSEFMRFWNVLVVSILIYYVPKIINFDKVLLVGMIAIIILYLWGAFFSNNIGLNLKTYGNLLLFFIVAYQTFALFRREQEALQLKEKQLMDQEKDVAIGKIARLLAHDVRKPLELMKLVIDKLLSGDASEEFIEIAKEDMEMSISSVDQQVNDIINYSKTSFVQLTEISFYKVLAHAIKQIMATHQEMKIDIEYNFNQQTKIFGDQMRLSGALANLLTNSVEAIRDLGGSYEGKIKLSTFCENDHFIFKIFNDGPEIPDHLLTNIFKPLFTHGKTNGTGLGLASVVKTLNEHNGSIIVENRSQEGVEFILKFQKGFEFDDSAAYEFKNSSILYNYDTAKILNIESPSPIPFRVLVLDNDPSKVEIINKHITKGYSSNVIQRCSNYDEAVNLIKRNRFDLYLLNSQNGGKLIYENSLYYLSAEVILYSENLPTNLTNLCQHGLTNRKKILFVDDTKLFRVSWLMFHGEHNIQCVSSPEEALSMVEGKNIFCFDIFVLDLHFSNSSMDGISLAKRIRGIYPKSLILISSSINDFETEFRLISKSDYDVRKYSF